MSIYKLSEVEAFRAQVLLEEALKKLHFLTSINSSATLHGDELTQFMGEEISRIIQEQRELERKYEELIAQRGQLGGLCNKGEFLRVQGEIGEVSKALKESNKSLCRNLKENPNVHGNMLKLQSERTQVQEWLEETKMDLIEQSFANLSSKVDNERKQQDQLLEVRKKEKEASTAVKQLEAESARARADNDKETKVAQQDIKNLKDELQKDRTVSEIEFKFEEKKLRAQEQALLRVHAQIEKKLLEELEELRAAQEMETTVHDKALTYLHERHQSLKSAKERWENDKEGEKESRQVEIDLITAKRHEGLLELETLQDKRREEASNHQEKEEEMRNAVLIERQRREQLQRMAEAVLFLQDEGRKYIERIQARLAARKGKKGKKGKRKK